MRKSPFIDYSKYFSILFSIIIISLIIVFITRVRGGLSAIVLSILALLLFFYWANEIRLTLKKQPGLGIIRSSKKLTYEFIKTTNGVDLIAQISGQQNNLKVNLSDNKIIISSNDGLFKKIKVSKNLRILNYHFKNGTLTVHLLYNTI